MASRRRRRRPGSIFGLVSDLADDVKDFVDDEIVDRGRRTERDLRRSSRRWAEDDRDGRRPSGSRAGREDLDEVREAVRALTEQLGDITARSEPGPPRDEEPWPGYDEQTVSEIRKRLAMAADEQTVAHAVDYERRHKARRGVLDAARPRRARG